MAQNVTFCLPEGYTSNILFMIMNNRHAIHLFFTRKLPEAGKVLVMLPCGPGKPFFGHPNGRPSGDIRVYSCSMPNHGWASLALSITMLHDCLLLVATNQIKSKLNIKFLYTN